MMRVKFFYFFEQAQYLFIVSFKIGIYIYYFLLLNNSEILLIAVLANIRVMINKIKNIKNINLAIPAVATEIPVKPNKPAMREIIKKMKAQRSISLIPYFIV
jgi:hypothetical protein